MSAIYLDINLQMNFLSSEQDSFEEDDLIAFAWNKFLKQGKETKRC